MKLDEVMMHLGCLGSADLGRGLLSTGSYRERVGGVAV